MKIIKLAVYAICVVVLLWIAVSFANIVSHNTERGHTLPAWNFFNLLMPETETDRETETESDLPLTVGKGEKYVLHG